MQVHRISKETIKPSSPTPPHLKTYNLSLLDQLSSRFYIARVLFYLHEGSDTASKTAEKTNLLKNSLSETLTHYYPFSGRLENGVSTDCNDEGIEFLEAQIDSQLSVLLENPDSKSLRQLFPKDLLGNSSYKGSLVVFQINYFNCGGMAISVCISHKLADGCTMSNFILDWAATARQEGEKVRPKFISEASSSSRLDSPLTMPEIELRKQSCVTRRFVFDGSKLANLKAMVAGSGVQNPTRVEVVTALLYKCAMASLTKNTSAQEICKEYSEGMGLAVLRAPHPSEHSGDKFCAYRNIADSKRGSMLIQTVNMRPRMIPPLPENSVGNFSWHFTVSLTDERERNLGELVGQMRKSLLEFYNKYEDKFKLDDWFEVIRELLKEAKEMYDGNTNIDVFSSSSMCRFPFYEVDFGWGKPVWVALAGNVFKNTFVLMDTRSGDGVEAWVTLDERDMAVLEHNEELLAFASLNPSVMDI